VEQPAVELDDQPERFIDHVTEHRTAVGRAHLPLRPGDPWARSTMAK
jgi:hypothetical protein